MTLLAPYLHLLAARAEWLVLVVPAAALLGDALGRRDMQAIGARGQRFLATLQRKLDRPARGIATLVYRGIIALTLLLIPAVIAGILLERPLPWVQGAKALLLILWFGHGFATYRVLNLWQRARRGTLPLELPGLHFLFADTHAVLRHLVLTQTERFATAIVGASVWYLIGGMPTMLVYLTAATAARHYRTPAFGWAARALFGLLDALPRALTLLVMLLAALFTPQTHPIAACRARSWPAFTARLLGVSLGGRTPAGDQPWVGTGTPKLTALHLRRLLQLLLVATILLTLLYAAPHIHELLISQPKTGFA
ncbi:MAG: hypothetical protein V4735_03320 [Pseudomonadota bacterium]